MTYECLVLFGLDDLYRGQEAVEGEALRILRENFLDSDSRIHGEDVTVVLQELRPVYVENGEVVVKATGTVIFKE